MNATIIAPNVVLTPPKIRDSGTPDTSLLSDGDYRELFGLLALVGASAGAWLLRTWPRLESGPEKHAALGYALGAAALIGQNLFSPDLRFGVSSFIVFFLLGAAVGRSAGAEIPLPAFPGRFALAGCGAALLALWGRLAAEPLFAHRRLVNEPSFYVAPAPELDSALAGLERQLAADPGNADLAENLGYYYAKQKLWPQAVARFQLAARLAPERPGPLNNLGNIHYLLGDRESAIAYWKRSLAARPDQIDAHANLGKALYEVGRLKESSAHLQAVLRLDPRNEKAQILLKKMVE